jgi:hypothetical protein
VATSGGQGLFGRRLALGIGVFPRLVTGEHASAHHALTQAHRDLRHHAITKLAESSEASEQTVMAIAGHVSREMLEHYSHIRQQAKRKAVESLDNVTITSQLAKWEAEAEQRDAKKPNNKGKNGRP